jgi:large subunit ribosomal protein L11
MSVIKLIIPATKATSSPPIGPALGQKGIKAHEFCKTFNEMSKEYIPGISLRCTIETGPEKSNKITVKGPTTTYLLKRVSGVERASTQSIVARISCKAMYELALTKQKDPSIANQDIKKVYSMMLASATNMGFEFF